MKPKRPDRVINNGHGPDHTRVDTFVHVFRDVRPGHVLAVGGVRGPPNPEESVDKSVHRRVPELKKNNKKYL